MKEKIRTESYVMRKGERISVEKLLSEEREDLAIWLKETYLNELFRGHGKVYPVEEKEKT